jgi:hypothetical protein
MRPLGCFVGIWMKMVTRKVIAFKTELKIFLGDAFVDVAWLSHTQASDSAVFTAASITNRLFNGDVEIFGNSGP